jgi:hypothetical protein
MTAVGFWRGLRWAPLRTPSGFKSSKQGTPFQGVCIQLFARLFALYVGVLRRFHPGLLHGFVAFELLQKIQMTARGGFLHRFFIGRTKLLSDCSSNGLARLVWQASHMDQCLESNIVPEPED